MGLGIKPANNDKQVNISPLKLHKWGIGHWTPLLFFNIFISSVKRPIMLYVVTECPLGNIASHAVRIEPILHMGGVELF